jgi:hypothetical protein
MAVSEGDLRQRLKEASCEAERQRAENERLRTLLALARKTQAVLAPTTSGPAPRPDAPASASDKVALVRGLFRGREDVYAARWENARTGKSGYVPAVAGGWSSHGAKSYLPLNDEAIERHLRGQKSIGVYPLLTDDTCCFLACDLDGKTWQLDALALVEACGAFGFPRRWSGAAQARGRTSGSSSPSRSRPRRLAASALCCCGRR